MNRRVFIQGLTASAVAVAGARGLIGENMQTDIDARRIPRWRGFNLFSQPDHEALLAVLRGEHCISGMSNRLLRGLMPDYSSGRMSRTEIRDHFKRNQNRDKLDAALKLLKKHGMVRRELRSKPGVRGPKMEFWSAT